MIPFSILNLISLLLFTKNINIYLFSGGIPCRVGLRDIFGGLAHFKVKIRMLIAI